jgi:hypothetical protein
MPNPNTAPASTDKKSAGTAHKRSRLLKFFRNGPSAPAATQPNAVAAGQAAPAKPATSAVWTKRDLEREKAKAGQLRALAQETQNLLPLVEFVQNHDPSMKAEYFAIKQAIFDKDLEGATARFNQFKPRLEQLERDVGRVQRSKADAQSKYLSDLKKSGVGATVAAGETDHRFHNLSNGNMTFSPQAQDLMDAHGVSEPEAAAIRVFTQKDYEYINPAVANQRDRTDRKLADGRDWMDVKKHPDEPEAPAGARFQFSGAFSEAPVKALQATLKAKGKGPADPELATLLALVPQIGLGTAKVSAHDFSGLLDTCFAKLPSFNPVELNGVQQAILKFLQLLRKEVNVWKEHELKQEEIARDPEKLKAYNQKREAQIAAIKNYEEGESSDAGSKRNLALEGSAHAAMALEGIRKLPMQEVTLYRGLHLSPSEFDRQYRAVKTITCEALVSYTTELHIAKGFRTLKFEPGNVMVLLEIKTKVARDVQAFSAAAAEAERVLLPGDKLDIVDIVDNGQQGFTVRLVDHA